jgi:hypothetical protein
MKRGPFQSSIDPVADKEFSLLDCFGVVVANFPFALGPSSTISGQAEWLRSPVRSVMALPPRVRCLSAQTLRGAGGPHAGYGGGAQADAAEVMPSPHGSQVTDVSTCRFTMAQDNIRFV